MLKINPDLCNGCGQCEDTCAFGSVSIIDGQAVVNDSCTLCGACLDECPAEAISVMGGEKTSAASGTGDIWVWLETGSGDIKKVSLELLGCGRKLADFRGARLVGVLISDRVDELTDQAFAYGADLLYCANHADYDRYETGLFTDVLVDMVIDAKPSTILFGATPNGRDLAPRVAARLATGLTADCTQLEIDGESGLLLQTRPAFGGSIMATIVTPHHQPQLATVRPGVMQPLQPNHSRLGEVIAWPVMAPRNRLTTFLREIPSTRPGVDIEDAEIIVAGGRGVGSPEGLKMLDELAAVLDGVVAVSRGPVEEGWISADYQIGQTGKTVRPRLYIACGISGTIQHLVGMQGSDVIVAINKDQRAPIFKIADYGLVGDMFDIVPHLIRKISAVKSGEQSNS